MKSERMLVAIGLGYGALSCVPTPAAKPPPACHLEVTRLGVEGDLGLAFLLGNPTRELEQGTYSEPLIDFELEVTSADQRLVIERGPADASVVPQPLTLPPGSGIRLHSPVRLRFEIDDSGHAVQDKPGQLSGADADTANEPPVGSIWRIRHAAAPVHIRAVLDLGSMGRRVCEADYGAGQPPG